jgi:EAL domain-containing protein (putative c-di-GMP-specific phosphodiesterase class I)
MAKVDPVLDQLRDLGCVVLARRPGLADISFGQQSRQKVAKIAEALAVRISSEPVSLDGLQFHVALSCVFWSSANERARRTLPDCDDAGEGSDWSAGYQQDMALAARALDAMRDGRLNMSWQPVVSAGSPERSLYHEGLARIIDEQGGYLPVGDVVEALERLGLVRAFDHEIVATVLDEIEGGGDVVLGVNISGKSARLDAWWTSLFERLRNPDIARRLVIEITETAALAPEAPAFADALRKLGCRVALDDFGIGHASLRNVLALSPDIIKIDAFFLRNAALSPAGQAMFAHLVGIAGAVAPIVIVEGVETEDQARLADEAQSELAARSGDCWQQGYLFGRPSFWRSWRHTASDEPQRVSLKSLSERSSVFRPGLRVAIGGAA